MQIVRASAHLYDNPTDLMGYGIPNFEIAYNALQILQAQTQFLEIQFAMYPNPAKDVVSFTIPSGIDSAVVSVFATSGQHVFSSEITPNQNTLDISGIAPGIYITKVVSGGTKNSFKLIIK
jgi:hypothetical protein